MTTNLTEWTDTLIHLHALASRLEGEGQYNLAKLARAAADALCRQAAYQQPLPSDSRQLAADISLTAEALSRLDASAELLSALTQGADLMFAAADRNHAQAVGDFDAHGQGCGRKHSSTARR